MGRRFLAIMVSMFFDDSHITDRAVYGPSAQWSFGILNDLLGTPFAEEKRQEAAAVGTFLGLDFDLSAVHMQGRAQSDLNRRVSPSCAMPGCSRVQLDRPSWGKLQAGLLRRSTARMPKNGSRGIVVVGSMLLALRQALPPSARVGRGAHAAGASPNSM